MFSSASFVLAVAASAIAATTPADAELVQKLRLAPTAIDRLALLSDDQFTFNFFGSTTGLSIGEAGRTIAATPDNFPAIVGNGVAMTIGLLGPCGINTPHTHPRATEFNFAVNGTFRIGTLPENGARFVYNELKPGQASVFPQGAIHFEQNLGCETAMFVAAFNGEDPGVLAMAQRFFGLPPDILGATLGGLSEEQIATLATVIPDNIALGVEECRQRCGLTSMNPPTAQQQPRVSGNALPATTAPVFASSASPATASYSPAGGSSVKGNPASLDALSDSSNSGGNLSTSSNDDTEPLLIALVVVNGILAVVVVGAIIMYFFTRNTRTQTSSYSHRYQPASKELPRADDLDEPIAVKGGYYDPYAAAAQQGRPASAMA